MTKEATGGFSAQERRSMKERAAELKSEARGGRAAAKAAADAEAMAAKIEAMEQPDRGIAERIHAIVSTTAPQLQPKLYYGQPGWAKDGKVVVFFRSGLGDKLRYSTLGFSETADLDEEDGMWATSFAVEHLTEKTEKQIAKLVARAAGRQ